MIALPLAFSLSHSFTEVGAVAAFAALLGIAILSLLAFSQAREIKRLREWAGRAPERATELEQRVSADAAARVQRSGAPPAPARMVPRKTPLVSAPVSTAVNATVAAAGMGANATPATPRAPAPPEPDAQPAMGEGAVTPQASEAQANEQESTEGGVKPAVDAAPTAPERDLTVEAGETAASTPVTAAGQAAPVMLGAAASMASAGEQTGVEERSAAEPTAPAPATAAARAAGVGARAPLPPSPSSPAPPGVPSSGAPSLPAYGDASAPPVQSPKPSARPPAPAAARRVPSRAVGASGSDATPRPASPSRGRTTSAVASTAAGAASARPSRVSNGASGRKYFKPERSSARATVLIVGGVVVAVLLLIFAVSALKGGGSTDTATQSSSAGETQPTGSHTSQSVPVAKPAEIAVAVLNGTSTAGLAHHLAGDLQQSGYTRALALAGVPPGTHATTVVEYTHGNRAEAQAVAKALNVTQVQALESTIASLAGSATIVVLAGADQATQLGGGGAQSNGEPAAGSGGEATAGSGQ